MSSNEQHPTTADALEDRKGYPIKLIGSTAKKHRPYNGVWFDAAIPATRNYYYVIIQKPDPDDELQDYLEPARVCKSNVEDVPEAPTTYLEAAVQQVPQLEERLINFAKMVAKCRISKSRELSDLIAKHIDRETSLLIRKGPAANYKIIDTSVINSAVVSDNEEAVGI